jgi:hypothetical protein
MHIVKVNSLLFFWVSIQQFKYLIIVDLLLEFIIGGCVHGGKYHPNKNIARHDVTKKIKEIACYVKLHYDHEKQL